MKCYYQGCNAVGTTKEHVPPKSFFPKDERLELITVKSCPAHNCDKSNDDMYAFAQICMNASPSNRAREMFLDRVAPQLSHNNDALRRLLVKGSVKLPGGAVAYEVDSARLDAFFDALCFGLVFKSQGGTLPARYRVGHVYHSLSTNSGPLRQAIEAGIHDFYEGEPVEVLKFGNPKTRNERIYTVQIHGLPDYQGSITIVHTFFGVFKVTSMLTDPLTAPAGSSE